MTEVLLVSRPLKELFREKRQYGSRSVDDGGDANPMPETPRVTASFTRRSADAPQVVIDLFRIENGKLAEHWDVMQDEVPVAARGGVSMFDPEEGALPSQPPSGSLGGPLRLRQRNAILDQ